MSVERLIGFSGIRILNKQNYDVGLIAVGSEPVTPKIPGVENDNVVFAPDVYDDQESLAESILVVGGGEVGVETGLHLALNGHNVTLLEMLDTLAPDTTPALHYRDLLMGAVETQHNLRCILKARCTAISYRGVTYLDENGREQTIEAGNVVIAVGMRSKSDEALKYADVAERCFMIGDCDVVGSIQEAMRSAFGIASTL